MSLHNLATVFGPTLLRPSEKESKLPANPSQPITMTDSWSLEVMSQVWETSCSPCRPGLARRGGGVDDLRLCPTQLQRATCYPYEGQEGPWILLSPLYLAKFAGPKAPPTGWSFKLSSCPQRGLLVRELCERKQASQTCHPLPYAFPLPSPREQVQVLLYFLQLEAIPAPDSKRQSVLFSTEV